METFHLVGISIFLLGAALGTVGPPAILIIFFGMAIYCSYRSYSSVGKKITLILLLLFTPPFGAVFYFFAVYRKQVAAHHEAVNA
jgi:multisubunit Na+/H+ antiporter MnhG subunit